MTKSITLNLTIRGLRISHCLLKMAGLTDRDYNFGHSIVSQHESQLISSVQVINLVHYFSPFNTSMHFFSILSKRVSSGSLMEMDMRSFLSMMSLQDAHHKFWSIKDFESATQFVRKNFQVFCKILSKSWVLTKCFCLAAHISLMLPREYRTVSENVLKRVQKKWKDRKISFKITRCKAFPHQDRLGKKEWIICFNITSSDAYQLRRELGLRNQADYNSHITILEKEIKRMWNILNIFAHAQTPLTWEEILRPVCLQNSPPITENSYPKFKNPRTTFEITLLAHALALHPHQCLPGSPSII